MHGIDAGDQDFYDNVPGAYDMDQQLDQVLGIMPEKEIISTSAADRLGSITNLPDFIIETLSISLDMNKNQAAALLASN